MSESPQIGRSQPFGNLIYDFIVKPDILNIVDVGMGGGLGTTKIIYDAIIESKKRNYNVSAIEIYTPWYEIAKSRLPKLENFNLLNGYITRRMMRPHELPDKFFTGYTRKEAIRWYDFFTKEMGTVDNISDKLTEKIDLIILDGGTFSSYYEFQLLKDRCKYFVLDDTNDIKNVFVLEEMISQPEKYSVIEQDHLDRNGWAIVKKI
jgi:hypothetical protein